MIDTEFNDSIELYGINLADINLTNTDIKVIPFIDKFINDKINQSLQSFTWKTIELTKKNLRIQLNFTYPDSISTRMV